jgi:hypothetical protein
VGALDSLVLVVLGFILFVKLTKDDFRKQANNLHMYNIYYNNIILPVVSYGCDTWSLTLTGEHRLGVLENRVLRGIFGPKRDEMAGG